jgi:hypothetical protein
LSQQGLRQQVCRTSTGKPLDYNGDFMAEFDKEGIAGSNFNARLLNWINTQLGTTHNNLPAAQAAFAAANSSTNFSAVGTFTLAP